MLLALIPLVSTALAGSVELQLGAVADRNSARHVLLPQLGLRGQLDRRDTPWLATLELAGSWHRVSGAVFRQETLTLRTGLGVGAQHRTGKVGVHGWLGPALVTRVAKLDERPSSLTAQGGIRGASGFSWFLGEHLALRFQLGSTVRFDRRTSFDFDGNVALAVRWR